MYVHVCVCFGINGTKTKQVRAISTKSRAAIWLGRVPCVFIREQICYTFNVHIRVRVVFAHYFATYYVGHVSRHIATITLRTTGDGCRSRPQRSASVSHKRWRLVARILLWSYRASGEATERRPRGPNQRGSPISAMWPAVAIYTSFRNLCSWVQKVFRHMCVFNCIHHMHMMMAYS